mgnify:CR=1 FL=1
MEPSSVFNYYYFYKIHALHVNQFTTHVYIDTFSIIAENEFYSPAETTTLTRDEILRYDARGSTAML